MKNKFLTVLLLLVYTVIKAQTGIITGEIKDILNQKIVEQQFVE